MIRLRNAVDLPSKALEGVDIKKISLSTAQRLMNQISRGKGFRALAAKFHPL